MPYSNTDSTHTVQKCETTRRETTNVDFTVTDLTNLLQSSTSPITEPLLTTNLHDTELESIRGGIGSLEKESIGKESKV